MGGVLPWLRRGSGSGRRGSAYRSATYEPLRPWQVRQRRFGLTRVGRRGLDPAEVGEFLERVAADLEGLYAELARTYEQNRRMKDALGRWRAHQAWPVGETGRR